MIRKSLWVFIALFTKLISAQQVQIQAIQPNPYYLKSEDIFNLQVTNPTLTSIEVKIKGIWFLEGKKAVELMSENTILQPGVNTFSSQSPGINSKVYYAKAVDEVESSIGNLPAGHYRACIYLSCIKPDCNGACANILASEITPCYEFTLEQPTPLLLNSQVNGNISNEHRPSFTWIPPMPLGGNPDVNYTLTLVKKNSSKQGCTDAILRNRPLLKQDNINGTILNYPADTEPLDTGDYAWQVSAMYEGLSVAISEVWCFRVEEKTGKEDSNVYVKLKTNDYDVHHCKSKLYFAYDELYTSEMLEIKLYDPKGKLLPVKQEFKTEYGESLFVVDLEPLKLNKQQIYSLLVKDQAGKKYKLRFQCL